MSCGKHLLSFPFQLRSIELHFHKLIHVLHDQHVAIQLHHTVIFCQVERREFGPAVIESRICGIVFSFAWEQVLDALFRNPTSFERGMAFRRKGISIECDKRICGIVLLERMIEGDETGEILGIGNESGPD